MKWELDQSNGFWVWITFQQHDNQLSGTISSRGKRDVYAETYTTGEIDGTVQGPDLNFTAHWSGGSAGVYSGRVNDDGTISGNTRDRANRGSRATWRSSEGQATCLATAPTGGAVIGGQAIPPGTQVNPMGHGGVNIGTGAADAFRPRVPGTCTVLQATDVFDDCRGRQTGMFLEAGKQGVTLVKRCAVDESWFNVKWPAGQGWVFSGEGHVSLNCP